MDGLTAARPRPAGWNAQAWRKLDAYLRAGFANDFADYDTPRRDRSRTLAIGFTVATGSGFTAAQIRAALTQRFTGHGGRLTAAQADDLDTAGVAYLTGELALSRLAGLAAEAFVTEIQLCADLAPVRGLPRRPVESPPTQTQAPPRLPNGATRLLGVIDHGCAFAHQALRRGALGTRVHALWDQDRAPDFPGGDGSLPAGFGYGRQVGRARLQSYMQAAADAAGRIDEEACYDRFARYPAMRHRGTHGTWALGLLTQSGGAPASEALAAQADVVFVQLPRAILAAPARGCIESHALDGLRYMLACARDGSEVAVVLDYGTELGPHDGTSWFERALDALISQAWSRRNIELAVFFPSGNAHDRARHAVIFPSGPQPSAVAELAWALPRDNDAPVTLEMWFHEADPRCRVELIAPAEHEAVLAFEPAQAMNGLAWPATHAQCVVASAHARRSAPHAGATQTQVLIQMAPTFVGPDAARGASAPGPWTLRVTPCDDVTPQPIHVYVCWGGRNDGLPLRLLPSKLLPRQGHGATVRIVGDGGILGSGCGRYAFMVGGYQGWGRLLRASYSSGGPARGGHRAAPHPGADWLAQTEDAPSLPGIIGLGTRSASRLRVRGTSFAAPQAAQRWLAGTLTVQGPPTSTQPPPGSAQEPRAEFGEPRIV